VSIAALGNRNRRVGLIFFGVAAAMLGLGFASAPLYRLFCQVTGFDGTTQKVTAEQANKVNAVGRTISIRFDGNVAPDVPWTFRPERSTDTIQLGQRDLAFFVAKNNSDKPITGTATFNVEPEQTGQYFNKIQCFCFTEQTLQPGEEVRMPVLFYVDPKLAQDEDAKDVQQITLSYTFHKAEDSPS